MNISGAAIKLASAVWMMTSGCADVGSERADDEPEHLAQRVPIDFGSNGSDAATAPPADAGPSASTPPPVTMTFCPVVNEEYREARKTTARATSKGEPARCIGMSRAIFCRKPSGIWATKSVSTKFGTTRLTRTLCTANSAARLRVIPTSAFLATTYLV